MKGRFNFVSLVLAFGAGCLVTATIYSLGDKNSVLNNPFLQPPPSPPTTEQGKIDAATAVNETVSIASPAAAPSASVVPSASSSLAPSASSSVAPSPTPSPAASVAAAAATFEIPRSVLVNDTNEAEMLARTDLTNTAWVSMATSDESAILALTLFQTLRDVGTKAPHLVLMAVRGGRGSRHCEDGEWRKAHDRYETRNGVRMEIPCGSPLAIKEEIVNEDLLAAFERLGVEVIVMDTIPRNRYTEGIAGGSVFFWGAALSKFLAFNLTQYRKVIWLDADAFFLRNSDWLFALPPLSTTMTMACANVNGPQYAGGGGFVIEPSKEIFESLMAFSNTPNPNNEDGSWMWGDMEGAIDGRKPSLQCAFDPSPFTVTSLPFCLPFVAPVQSSASGLAYLQGQKQRNLTSPVLTIRGKY
jgi:hypothetical protein